MSTELTLYFERYAQAALDKVKHCLLAKGYYERVMLRLENKEDLSGELPIIKKLGTKKTTQVVQKALKDYQHEQNAAWELPTGLEGLAKSTITLAINAQEHLPRYEVLHQFSTEAGTVKVNITTAGENVKVELNAGKNRMAAQAALYELEKLVAFANLTQ